jgi:hypothetical protein
LHGRVIHCAQMHDGADTKRGRGLSWFGPSCLGMVLLACGGRTLDDGVYGYSDTSGSSSCSYRGQQYADGSAVLGPCFCFCNNGQIECEQGCSISSSGGASSSGGVSGGGTTTVGSAGYAAATSSGGVSTAGGSTAAGGATGGSTNVGGSYSTAGASSGGASSGGASSGGASSGGASSGGASSGGASSGGATSICGAPTRSGGVPALIDNMEDGDAYILPIDGRGGVWFTYNEGSANGYQYPSPTNLFSMLMVPSDATGGGFVANTVGTNFMTWGAGMGFVLNNGCPYDASIQHGIHFFARSELGPAQILVLLPTAATTPTDNNGTCVPFTTNSCYDDYQRALNLDQNWQEEYVPYTTLRQLGWGTPVSFDSRTLMGVNFQTVYGGGLSFSFSIDSISFY